MKTKFELRDGKPVIVKLPELDFIDDKDGKPIGIQRHIGRRPIAAFGNSDGDLQMLQWTAAGSGPRFCLYVHHTDAEREWAYDRNRTSASSTRVSTKPKAKGWTVVSMKDDWKEILSAESACSRSPQKSISHPTIERRNHASAVRARSGECTECIVG